jgi:hypothetical protein
MRARIGIWIGLLFFIAAAVPAAWHSQPTARAAPRAAQPAALPAAPNAPSDPTDIGCRPQGVATDQVRIEWKDTNAGAVAYDLYRREVSGSFSLLTTVAGATCADELCKFTDTGASNSTVYEYRVQANDGNSTSAFSSVCREPLFVNGGADFRAFYRLQACPSVGGVQVCTQNINDGNGDNIHVQDLLNTHAQYRAEYQDLGFKDFALYGGAKPFPIDLYPCNNGCMGGDGILIPPANVEGANFDPNTLGGSSYETFVVGHEAFHALQGRYGAVVDPYYKWLIEGQARSSEDKICIFNQTQCTDWDNIVKKYYVGQVQSYLGFPEQGLLDASYNAALFWTYVTEQFGTSTAEPAYGVDALVGYWERNEVNSIANTPKDGIGTLNDYIAGLGSPRTFTTVFQDFAVANYAKEYIDHPAPAGFEKYNYKDEEAMAAGTYNPVKLTESGPLGVDEPIFGTTSLQAWGTRYFEVDPDPAVPTINIEVETLPGTPHQLYYHVLAIEAGQIVDQWIDIGTSFSKSISNAPDYDRLALVVASMDNPVNFTYGFNLTDGLFILSPNAQFPAAVGEATSPEKFIMQVQVLDELGDPVAGIDTSQMSITVGSAVLSPTALIGSSYIAGQYWMTVRAPTDPGCTTCPLTVAYTVYTDTEPSAIEYGPKPDTDNMIVIDRSGSMIGAKIVAAQDAAKLYVDSYSDGDKVGVISFNTAPDEEYPLTEWDEPNGDPAKTAIANMAAPTGNTAIGAALREANADLVAQASPNPAWSIVLLSDGVDTVAETDDHLVTYLGEYNKAKKDGDPVPIIHVVAVGDDADGVELSKLTNASGGQFQFLPESGALAAGAEGVEAVNINQALSEIYRVFAEAVLDEQQVYVNHFSNPTNVVVSEITVDGAASQAIFVLKYSPANEQVQSYALLKPGSNTPIPPTLDEAGHKLWRVPIGAGEAGTWRLSIRSLCQTCADHYMVEAALISDLELRAFLGLPVEDRIKGKPMPVIAFLADVAPLLGAHVTASSERNGNVIETITLHDDGLHGDGAATDGAYGGTLINTNQAGGYSVVVDAEGTSPFAGPYTRRVRLGFFLPDGPDSDQDRIPDWWEDEYPCMDSTKNDESLDYDGDGLPNAQEYFRKTNPCDPDTDDGGESDGSEVNRPLAERHDPLFPGDDNAPTITFKPWPGVNFAVLRLALPAGVQRFDVERSTSPTGTFTVVGNDLLPVDQFKDEGAANDVMACYRIVVTGADGSSTSPVHCTTPKADPHPPHAVTVLAWARVDGPPVGQVAGPAASEAKVPRTLTLRLAAEDNPYTEDHPPFDGAFLFPEAIQTGVTHMMISNRADFAGAQWEPYQTRKQWTLDVRPDNTATVYALFRDGAGNVSDVIAAVFDVDPNLTEDPQMFLPNLGR